MEGIRELSHVGIDETERQQVFDAVEAIDTFCAIEKNAYRFLISVFYFQDNLSVKKRLSAVSTLGVRMMQ